MWAPPFRSFLTRGTLFTPCSVPALCGSLNIRMSVGSSCFESILARSFTLQPPPAWPSQWWSGGWSWSQGCCVSLLVSFCATVKGEVGSGRRRQHNSFVYVVVSCEKKWCRQGNIIKIEVDKWWLWLTRHRDTHIRRLASIHGWSLTPPGNCCLRRKMIGGERKLLKVDVFSSFTGDIQAPSSVSAWTVKWHYSYRVLAHLQNLSPLSSACQTLLKAKLPNV